MYRIGIIGSENSHAMAFATLFNKSGRYPDLRVVSVYGEDQKESLRIQQACEVQSLPNTAADMLGTVEAVMITSRNGALHAGYARPFIEAGLPMFIDKPITNDGQETWDLLRRAREKGNPIMGGSSLKFTADTLALRDIACEARASNALIGGHVWAPIKMHNPYGDFYFYAAHLIETALMIFGFDAQSVTALRKPNSIAILLVYADFTIQLTYMEEVFYYGATVLTKDGATSREISLDGAYDTEGGHFATMLRDGTVPQPIEELAIPIFALNAIERAYSTGLPQSIAPDFSL